MAWIKICGACGHKNEFEKEAFPPIRCGSCGADIIGARKINKAAACAIPNAAPMERAPVERQAEVEAVFVLEDPQGSVVVRIPSSGCVVVGRNGAGAEYLENFPAVSRAHITVSQRGQMGIVVEDTSKFGTHLNGALLIKNEGCLARAGDRIEMGGAELLVKLIAGSETK